MADRKTSWLNADKIITADLFPLTFSKLRYLFSHNPIFFIFELSGVNMKINFGITMFLLIAGTIVSSANGKQHFNRKGFYAVMASENLDSVNEELRVIETLSIENREAFEGVLLMKKAGLVAGPPNKISLFKSGHKKLEEAISKDNKDAELRFLRLMIQENAPKILGYKKQIGEDNKLIHSAFKSLPPVVQKAVAEYSKKSKVLKPPLS